MRKIIALTLLSALPTVLATPAQVSPGRQPKVSVCHATHSERTPFVLITTGRAAERAHETHQDGEDVLAHRDLGLPAGPADPGVCDDPVGDPGGGPINF